MKLCSISIVLCLLCPLWLIAQSDDYISAWANQTDLTSAQVGFYAVDAETGVAIAGYQENKAMIPASLMKLFTSIAALEYFGSDRKFETTLYYRGSIDENGVLTGDLVLSGEGDPTLGSSRLGDSSEMVIHKMAEALTYAGIKKVSGNFIVDESSFLPLIPGTWSWEDLTNYYAAIPHAVNFMDNQFTITFETSAVGEPAKIVSCSPEIPGLVLKSEVVAAAVSGDQTFCFGHPFHNEITVQGMLPENRRSYSVKGAIPQPGKFLAAEIIDAAALQITGETEVIYSPEEDAGQRVKLISLTSPELHEIVEQLNLRSINLYAEALSNMMAAESGIYSKGAEWLQNFWQNKIPVPTVGLKIKDGSGLSHYNTVTAAQLTEILRIGYSGAHRDPLLESLPLAGRSGSLYRFGVGTALENNLRAKSGYMTGSRGYAGFVKLQSGRTAAFAIMVNNYSISAADMRRKIEQLLVQFQQNN